MFNWMQGDPTNLPEPMPDPVQPSEPDRRRRKRDQQGQDTSTRDMKLTSNRRGLLFGKILPKHGLEYWRNANNTSNSQTEDLSPETVIPSSASEAVVSSDG